MPANGRPRSSRSPALYAAVVLSGAASLMYQVAWTRRLASVTSVTVTAQALVLSTFMAGLGLGAYFAGRHARQLARPLLGYAAAEAIAAALAALSVPLIAWSDAIRTGWAALGGSLAVGLWVQLVAVCFFLLLPTALLGTSLPFIIEAHDRRHPAPGESAQFISVLYGINTVGAAAGCLVAGFTTVERLGLWRTTLAGAVLALIAAAIMTVIGRQPETAPPERPPDPKPRRADAKAAARAAEPAAAHGPRRWWMIAAAGGFLGLAAEVIWTRLLLLVVLNTVYAYTLVLAGVLLGIAAGSLLAMRLIQRASSRKNRPGSLARAAAVTQILAALSVALAPQATLWVARNRPLQLDLATGFNLGADLVVMAFLAVSAALVAALLPLLVAILRRERAGADAFGTLYAWNTAGAVLGSLAAGFVMIPLLGSSGAVITLELGTLAVAFLLLQGGNFAARSAVFATAIAATLLALSVRLPRAIYEARLDPGTEILEFKEGRQSDVMVTQDQQGLRRIWINSAWVAGTGGGHKSLGYLPPLFLDQPDKVLGIALGTGQTFASVFAHGVHELECVELDPGIIELSKRWFREASNALFEHPNVFVHEDDGRAFLRATKEHYDVIVLEPLQAWTAGTSNLYSREFYAEARRALNPGGVLAQWIPFYGQGLEETRAMVRAAIDVFPEASLWLDAHDGILILHTQPFRIDPAQLAERIRARGLAAELATTQYAELPDLLSLFVMGPKRLREWAAGAPVLSDDRPFLEFAAARQVRENLFHMPELYRSHLESVGGLAEPVGEYLENSSPASLEVAHNATLVRNAFLDAQGRYDGDAPRQAEAYEAALGGLTRPSPLLTSRYRMTVMAAAASDSRDQRWPEAMAMYQRGLDHDREFGDAGLALAILNGEQGRYEEARHALARIDHIDSLSVKIAQVRRVLDAREQAARPATTPAR